MKRINFPILILIFSGIFAGFLIGVFVGRSGGGQTLYVAPTATILPSSELTEAMEETEAVEETEPPQAPVRININTADVQTLMKIPGVGETLAREIVDYRKEWGKFITLEELMEVDGIGEKKFEKIKEYVIVR